MANLLYESLDDKAQDAATAKAIIGKHNPQIIDGKYTPEIMWAMGRISCAIASSDAKKIAYNVTYYSVEENIGHSVIHVMDNDGNNDILLTLTAANESNPQWIKGDTKLAFLSDEGGKSEIWEMNPDGTERKKEAHQNSENEIEFPDQYHFVNIDFLALTLLIE